MCKNILKYRLLDEDNDSNAEFRSLSPAALASAGKDLVATTGSQNGVGNNDEESVEFDIGEDENEEEEEEEVGDEEDDDVDDENDADDNVVETKSKASSSIVDVQVPNVTQTNESGSVMAEKSAKDVEHEKALMAAGVLVRFFESIPNSVLAAPSSSDSVSPTRVNSEFSSSSSNNNNNNNISNNNKQTTVDNTISSSSTHHISKKVRLASEMGFEEPNFCIPVMPAIQEKSLAKTDPYFTEGK